MHQAKSGEDQVCVYVVCWGGGGQTSWKLYHKKTNKQTNQSCSVCPETHFGFGIFEIRRNFENWKFFVTVHRTAQLKINNIYTSMRVTTQLKRSYFVYLGFIIETIGGSNKIQSRPE